MKIACLCCTYLRSHLLGRVVKCFQEQDYPLASRRLLILDDAGEYKPQSGEGWTLVSRPARYTSLGAKRNAAARIAVALWPDVEAFAVWDDDDLYLPHALVATVSALARAPLSRPGRVLYETGTPGDLRQHATNGLYHSGWAYARRVFEEADGYDAKLDNGEDQEFLRRLQASGVVTVDPLALGFGPFLIYCGDTSSSYSMSHLGRDGWRRLGEFRQEGVKDRLTIAWPYDLRNVRIRDEVLPMPLEDWKSRRGSKNR